MKPETFDAQKHIMELFEKWRAEWLERAREAAACLGATGREVTINDVRAVCPPPDYADPRVMGAVFTRKDWECVRYERSTRATCHHRPVGVFRLKGVGEK